MNCREAETSIFAARDGALAEPERAALSSHLASCESCRKMESDLAQFAEAWRAENASVRVPDPGLEWRKLQRTIGEREGMPRRSRATWIAFPAATLAAAAIAVGIFVNSEHTPAGQAFPTPAPAAAPVHVAASVTSPAVTPSAVVYVDDTSGWTFVWDDDSGQHI